MAGIWTAPGSIEVCQFLVGQASDPALQIGLYVNNFTPVWEMVLSDLTECTAPGYARFTFLPTSWVQNDPGSSPITNTYPPVLFSFTGTSGQTLYGYLVYDLNNSCLLYAERFGSPYTLPSGASNYVVIPTFSFGQCGAC
jgi:hypothetical protein